ncbi:MAG: sortase, partial [Candidatus Liptonbacteria bacterium]
MSTVWLERITIFLIFFFGASIFVYFLLNGGAYMRVLRYDLFLSSPFASADLKEGSILEIQAQPISDSPAGNPATAGGSVVANTGSVETTSHTNNAQSALPDGYEFYLSIPKIQINTPIVIPKDSGKVSVLASLEEGVGLYPGSAKPGQNGRAVILGHSSKATWYRGDYAYIFSLLPKLTEGDEVFVTTDNKKMIFRIFSKQILTPTDTNTVLAAPTAVPEITLITCYPIGGASKRNVVRAQLVSVE